LFQTIRCAARWSEFLGDRDEAGELAQNPSKIMHSTAGAGIFG
jgi:hypothetical protein